jgi:uncharacterized protein (TIGR03435 family)
MKQAYLLSALVSGLGLMAVFACAQNAAPPAPLSFEVASVKPSAPLDAASIQQGRAHIGMKIDGAFCDIGSFSLRDLIRTAYDVKDFQIAGADSLGAPLTAQRFDIRATLPAGTTEKQVPEMLQNLLAERFKLAVHRETRDQSIYALVVAKGGPKMKPSEPDPPAPDVPADAEPKKGETVLGQGTNQIRISGNPTDGKGITFKGAGIGQMQITMADGKMHLAAQKMTMARLAEVATNLAGRPVIDMTDLKGDYQVTLDIALGEMLNIARNAGLNVPGAPGGNALGEASDPSGSSIFASVQQLGLKLESRKSPLPFIVIDHFEKSPTEN